MSRVFGFLFLFILFVFLSFRGAVRADIVGSIRFSVKDAATGKPVPGATIRLEDSAKIRPAISVTTDKDGMAVASQLEARPWQATTSADNFEADSRQVAVAVDALTDVEISLEPIREKVIKVTGRRKLVRASETTQQNERTRQFITTFPNNAGNPQSLSRELKGNPGFIEDSVNQIHPRGEHSATAIYINGFELPGVLQGRAGQILSAETVQSLNLMTGAYAPEYGGETAAILNVTLRAGTVKPFQDFQWQGGGFNTGLGSVTLGGQAGSPIEPNLENQENAARRFGYLINLSGRRTDNALEPPQPDFQTAHNRGFSQTLFGNFDYYADPQNQFTITANSAPAYTQIANRAGLPDSYAAFGQGYGYGGALSRAQAQAAGITTQQNAGQDINQRDANTFGVLNWRHMFNTYLFALFSLGSLHTGQYLTNHNPSVNIFSLPSDNSIEFNPTLFRDGYETQVQGSLTLLSGNHTFKGGLLDDEQSGKESYQFIPASQLALDQLFATDPLLAPAGTLQTSGGNPVLDSRGVQQYAANPGATVPTLAVTRAGFYRAAFLQDTWKPNSVVTVNYGLRYDRYRQSQNLGQPTVDQSNLSPRMNTAFAVTPDSVFRLAFNRLFIQPPLAQGAIIGQPIQPETLNQYDASYEMKVAPGQVVKIAGYYKDIRHQIDTGLLFLGTQIGAYTSVNFDRGTVSGDELSWEYTPPDNIGISSYLWYTWSLARPSGFDNTGAPVPAFNDHDQRNTLGIGLANTWASGANVGLDFSYGSGLASSPLFDDHRIPRTQLDFHVGSPPLFFKSGPREGVGLALDVVNVFDSRQVINFNSGFSGTRFQQGRVILLSMIGHF